MKSIEEIWIEKFKTYLSKTNHELEEAKKKVVEDKIDALNKKVDEIQKVDIKDNTENGENKS